MTSSELKIIFKNSTSIAHQNKIYLLCVFRDENILLEYFINYYKTLGVTHFIMIDNLSEDNGVEYLKRRNDINIIIYQATGSYKEAAFGTIWINELLEKHCKDQYCLTVDVDELFYFDRNEFASLQNLIVKMESQDCNVVPVTLLDMYPKKINNVYIKGLDFLLHSPFFDRYNTNYYKSPFVIYKHFTHKSGGVRGRVFNKAVCIHKLPFFKYNFNPIEMSPGCHYFQENQEIIKDSKTIRLFKKPAVLLHFKFLKPNLADFFRRRVELNQDWDNSSEYQSYFTAINDTNAFELYDEHYSRKLENIESLNAFLNPETMRLID